MMQLPTVVRLDRVTQIVANLRKFRRFPYPQVYSIHEMWFMWIFHMYLYENTFVDALISEDMEAKMADRLIERWHQLPLPMKSATSRAQIREGVIDWKEGLAPHVARMAEVYSEYAVQRTKMRAIKPKEPLVLGV